MSDQQQTAIAAVAEILRSVKSILFVTGAGISADSGVPTYRGIGGLYEVDVTEEGYPIEEILSGSMLHQQPELTWKYLVEIAYAARGATFNRAHQVIAEMEAHFPRVWTLTQNVDGFHSEAGARNVIEIHGNMRSITCTRCGQGDNVEGRDEIEIPPRCSECGTVMRPDAVLFGESLPDAAISRLEREWDDGFDAVFSVGTSSGFPYIQAPIFGASEMGIPTIEINPSETLLTEHTDYHIPLGAAAALDAIWTEFQRGS